MARTMAGINRWKLRAHIGVLGAPNHALLLPGHGQMPSTEVTDTPGLSFSTRCACGQSIPDMSKTPPPRLY